MMKRKFKFGHFYPGRSGPIQTKQRGRELFRKLGPLPTQPARRVRPRRS